MHKLPDKPVSAGARELEPPTKKYKCETPVTGVWGRNPQRVQGQSPWSGDRKRNPPEAETLGFWMFTESRKFAHSSGPLAFSARKTVLNYACNITYRKSKMHMHTIIFRKKKYVGQEGNLFPPLDEL